MEMIFGFNEQWIDRDFAQLGAALDLKLIKAGRSEDDRLWEIFTEAIKDYAGGIHYPLLELEDAHSTALNACPNEEVSLSQFPGDVTSTSASELLAVSTPYFMAKESVAAGLRTTKATPTFTTTSGAMIAVEAKVLQLFSNASNFDQMVVCTVFRVAALAALKGDSSKIDELKDYHQWAQAPTSYELIRLIRPRGETAFVLPSDFLTISRNFF